MKTVFVDRDKMSLYTQTDLADVLGLNMNTIWYMIHRAHRLPEPQFLFGRRWYYTESEFNGIVKDYTEGESS